MLIGQFQKMPICPCTKTHAIERVNDCTHLPIVFKSPTREVRQYARQQGWPHGRKLRNVSYVLFRRDRGLRDLEVVVSYHMGHFVRYRASYSERSMGIPNQVLNFQIRNRLGSALDVPMQGNNLLLKRQQKRAVVSQSQLRYHRLHPDPRRQKFNCVSCTLAGDQGVAKV